jgi:hypothetical protein
MCVVAATFALLTPERNFANNALSVGCLAVAVGAFLATRRGIAVARAGQSGTAAAAFAIPITLGLGYVAWFALPL